MNAPTQSQIARVKQMFADKPWIKAAAEVVLGVAEEVTTAELMVTVEECKARIRQADATLDERKAMRRLCEEFAVDGKLTEADVSIILNGGNPLRPGDTVAVVADNANEWDGNNSVELDDPADAANSITLPATGTGAERSIEIPPDMGGIGFTDTPEDARLVQVDPPVTPNDPGVFFDTNLRHQPAFYGRTGVIGAWGEDGADWFKNSYAASGMQNVHDRVPQAFQTVKAGLSMVLRHRDFYVNQNLAPPDRATAQDPNWSNYAWNTYDWIGEQLTDPLITSGEAVLRVQLSMESTAVANTHPNWLKNIPGAAWATASQGTTALINWRTHPNFQFYHSDFYAAFAKKYANSGISQIVLSEYYLRDIDAAIAAGTNRTQYINAREPMWQALHDAIPLDGNGNRIAVLQKSFSGTEQLTVDTLIGLKMGVSQSDIRTWGHEEIHQAVQQLTPADVGADTVFARHWANGQLKGLTTLPSPMSPAHLADPPTGGFIEVSPGKIHSTPAVVGWFYSRKDIGVHLDTIQLRIDNNTVQNEDNIVAMLQEYGENGTRVTANPELYETVPRTR